MRTLAFIALISLMAFARCATCINEVVVEKRSAPNGTALGTLLTRRCGSFEGWAVKVKTSRLPAKDVFLGEMPDPVSVDEIKNGVHLKWIDDTHLVIDTPRWIGAVRVEKSYGDVSISYEPNEIPYPHDRANAP